MKDYYSRSAYVWKAIIFCGGSFFLWNAVLGGHRTELSQTLAHARKRDLTKDVRVPPLNVELKNCPFYVFTTTPRLKENERLTNGKIFLTMKAPLHNPKIWWWTLATTSWDSVAHFHRPSHFLHWQRGSQNATQPNFPTYAEISQIWNCMSNIWRFLSLKRGAKNLPTFGMVWRRNTSAQNFGKKCAAEWHSSDSTFLKWCSRCLWFISHHAL